jgi:hypothetical protein
VILRPLALQLDCTGVVQRQDDGFPLDQSRADTSDGAPAGTKMDTGISVDTHSPNWR